MSCAMRPADHLRFCTIHQPKSLLHLLLVHQRKILRVQVTSLHTHLAKWCLAVIDGTRALVDRARIEQQHVHLLYLYKGVRQGQGRGGERSLGSERLRSNPTVIQHH